MSDWEELERSANRMQERYERNRSRMYYSEREQIEREIRQMREIGRAALAASRPQIVREAAE